VDNVNNFADGEEIGMKDQFQNASVVTGELLSKQNFTDLNKFSQILQYLVDREQRKITRCDNRGTRLFEGHLQPSNHCTAYNHLEYVL
jgi:hypothetical protein